MVIVFSLYPSATGKRKLKQETIKVYVKKNSLTVRTRKTWTELSRQVVGEILENMSRKSGLIWK